MDNYEKLLAENDLYSDDLLRDFVSGVENWHIKTPREREQIAFHIQTCILLCNMETLEREEVVKAATENLKRKREEDDPSPQEPKRARALERPLTRSQTQPMPSTSRSSTTSSSSSSGSRTTISDTLGPAIDKAVAEVEYRFQLIRYSKAPSLLLNRYQKEWGIEKLSHMWDILDHRDKKFIRVAISQNNNDKPETYLIAKEEAPNNTALIIVNPKDGRLTLYDFHTDILPKEKLETFIIKRNHVREALGIIDTQINMSSPLAPQIFKSKFLEGCIAEWTDDFLSESYTIYGEKDLYKHKGKVPSEIRAGQLLDNLTNLMEPERATEIKYKGKLLPDGWTLNIETIGDTDTQMVGELVNYLEEKLKEGSSATYVNCSPKNRMHPEIVRHVLDQWVLSSKNTFSLLDNGTPDTCEPILKALGVGAKGRTYNTLQPDMQQKENKPPKPLSYGLWIEELHETLADTIDHGEYIPFSHLLEEPISADHPMAMLSEKMVKEITRKMLSTNVGIMASKMANTYSRLGGSYLTHPGQRNRSSRENVAIFPIVATLSNPSSESEVMRLCSGLCIRGPNHAKSPTDKISILTIEVIPNNPRGLAVTRILNKALILETEEVLLVVRQNSIMKEDCCYNTFAINALFNPINTFGHMTLDNPNLLQNQNMLAFQTELWESSQRWFVDRFVDGVLFAMLGNSRDEGYFSVLRKMYLILYNWRNNDRCASWDIEGFCGKANECLIDNPISMYHHKYLLRTIALYNGRGF